MQNQEIINYLKNGYSLTALEALEKFGCFRLASRVCEIKKLGHKIKTKSVKLNSGKRIALYYI